MSQHEEEGAGRGAAIEILGLQKWFGAYHALRNVTLSVEQGERIVVCGPSGSGKSTLVRCIDSLEDYQGGHILVNGVEVASDTKESRMVRREIGMVFQSFNLFPHLTALENLTLAPVWVKKIPRQRAEEIGMQYLEKVKIADQAHKYPNQLSGGQQQRVAIARAL